MCCEKDWIDVSTALLLPTIAILGSTIAFLQWRINKTRLNHELFDRRFLVFEASTNFIYAVLRDTSVKDDDRYLFLTATKGAMFLFKPDIVSYLDTLHKNAVLLRLHETKEDYEASHELSTWFAEQTKEIDTIFKGAIKIDG